MLPNGSFAGTEALHQIVSGLEVVSAEEVVVGAQIRENVESRSPWEQLLVLTLVYPVEQFFQEEDRLVIVGQFQLFNAVLYHYKRADKRRLVSAELLLHQAGKLLGLQVYEFDRGLPAILTVQEPVPSNLLQVLTVPVL